MSASAPFRFEGADLYASALRAQVIERCRRGLTHDMNNVVQSMHSGLELLSKCLETPGIARVTPQECVVLLKQQFAGLQQSLNKLLNEVAPAATEPEIIDLSALIEDVVHTLRHERLVSKAQLHLAPDLRTLARKSHLRYVLLALVLDAVDDLGGTGTLHISASRRDGSLVVEIRTVRSATSSAATTQSTPNRSTPLVEIATKLVAAEGGELDTSRTSDGRAVRLHQIAANTANSANEDPPQAPSEHTALRVLIADRNKDAADSLAMILQLEGYSAKTHYSAELLEETLKEFEPDLVLLDADLPGCNVSEIAVTLRDSRRGKLPLLAQVSSSDRRALSTFDAHLLRPVEWPQLQALVARAQALRPSA